MQKRVVLGIGLIVVGIFVFIASVLFFTGNSKLTGKVIDENIISDNKAQVENILCVENTCNPDYLEQICLNGEWVGCDSGEVCSLGACVKPKQVSASVRYVGGGSDEGSGGGGSSSQTTSSTPVVSENIISLGDIDGSVIQEIAENDKLTFNLNGSGYSIKGLTIVNPSASLNIDGKNTMNINIGEEKMVDFDSNGINDLSIIMKSISLTTKKAKLLLTKQ